jgi:hypothetical protein
VERPERRPLRVEEGEHGLHSRLGLNSGVRRGKLGATERGRGCSGRRVAEGENPERLLGGERGQRDKQPRIDVSRVQRCPGTG